MQKVCLKCGSFMSDPKTHECSAIVKSINKNPGNKEKELGKIIEDLKQKNSDAQKDLGKSNKMLEEIKKELTLKKSEFTKLKNSINNEK